MEKNYCTWSLRDAGCYLHSPKKFTPTGNSLRMLFCMDMLDRMGLFTVHFQSSKVTWRKFQNLKVVFSALLPSTFSDTHLISRLFALNRKHRSFFRRPAESRNFVAVQHLVEFHFDRVTSLSVSGCKISLWLTHHPFVPWSGRYKSYQRLQLMLAEFSWTGDGRASLFRTMCDISLVKIAVFKPNLPFIIRGTISPIKLG